MPQIVVCKIIIVPDECQKVNNSLEMPDESKRRQFVEKGTQFISLIQSLAPNEFHPGINLNIYSLKDLVAERELCDSILYWIKEQINECFEGAFCVFYHDVYNSEKTRRSTWVRVV